MGWLGGDQACRGQGRLAAAALIAAGSFVNVLAREPSSPTDQAGSRGTAIQAQQIQGARLFIERIEPVLRSRCFKCHSAELDPPEAGLRFDSPSRLARGGDSGSVIDLDDPRQSLLLSAIRHEGGLEMPPDGPPLSEATIADFARWVELGAPDPRSEDGDVAEPVRSSHWAFQPVARPELPEVRDAAWVQTPVDSFVLARLEDRDWRPAPPASRVDWMRRVTFDLTGLPPRPKEVRAYLEDASPQADAAVVDRLLSSPPYGERWAQHWLDVVRFAESEGFEYDRHLPGAWRYRDFVIQSLNEDKPYDQFVMEQLAGDEIDPDDSQLLAASVFHRLGPVRRNAGNPEIALSRNEVLTERTDIIGEAFLGLTVGCARCHNHKLEPITQRDYYQLQAYLAATAEHDTLLVPEAERERFEAQTARIEGEIERLKEELEDVAPEQRSVIRQQIADWKRQLPAQPPTIPGIRNDWSARTEIHVLRRGIWDNKGQAVGPGPLAVLAGEERSGLPADFPRPRTELARWLTDPNHPLTARVAVNRIWQSYFGIGIVPTANDFGTHGDEPSHPELLDWLASELVRGGWRLKPLHRLIVLSNTYRQASYSLHEREYAEADPEVRMLWRQRRRRLSAEEIRDAMLAVSGELNPDVGGPSVMVPVDPELVDLLYDPEQWEVSPDRREHNRRSIYLIAKRNLRLPFFATFDAPTLLTSCPRRESSVHAPQALELLNGDLSNRLARSFAARLHAECGDDPAMLVERAFWLALGRDPTDGEMELATAYLGEGPLQEFALAVFNLNGFLYVR